MDAAAEALHILGAGEGFVAAGESLGELSRLAEEGLPIESAGRLIRRLPVPERGIWRQLLLARSGSAHLTREASESASRLAYILALAKQVFGDWSHALPFLAKPHALLRERTPLQATQTEWGAREVEQLLRKIQFGLPV